MPRLLLATLPIYEAKKVRYEIHPRHAYFNLTQESPEMTESRNQTSHTSNQATADEISNKICGSYIKQFIELEVKMKGLSSDE